MSAYGTRAKATPAQRAEVERLAADGVSMRQIAARVFGDARYKGRVERILCPRVAQPVLPQLVEVPAADIDFSTLSDTEKIRLLFERRLAWLEANGPPSMNELRNLLAVLRVLMASEQHERLQQLHRQRREPKPALTEQR